MDHCDPPIRSFSQPPRIVAPTRLTDVPVPAPLPSPLGEVDHPSKPFPWEMSDSPVTLDPTDPFDAALIPIVQTNRRKRQDYAKDGDPFSNFNTTAGMLGLDGFGSVEAALFNVCQKIARLKALRANGRMNDTANEAVEDTYLDLAVYAVITYALARQQGANSAAERQD